MEEQKIAGILEADNCRPKLNKIWDLEVIVQHTLGAFDLIVLNVTLSLLAHLSQNGV